MDRMCKEHGALSCPHCKYVYELEQELALFKEELKRERYFLDSAIRHLELSEQSLGINNCMTDLRRHQWFCESARETQSQRKAVIE